MPEHLPATRALSTTLILSAALLCCRAVPNPEEHPDAYADAVGTVTISNPVMTALNAKAGPGKLLDLSFLYDEEALARAIQKPDLSSSLLKFEALRMSLQASYSGPAIDSTTTRTKEVSDGAERTRTTGLSESETTTRKTPEVPDLPEGSEVPESVQEAMHGLLARIEFENKLPPDQLATLIAAYKTFMVNLEEYYNLGGLITDTDLSDYLPYKMHFTVTAEPGWYPRDRLMDAVVEGELACSAGNDFRILTVTPAETAQAIDEFTASLREFMLTAGVSGSEGPAALNAQLEEVDSLAQRLQGLHTNKTLTVGYPSSSSFRIRFRAHRTPTREGKDLQPVSRILTAIVLVKSGSELSFSNVDAGIALEPITACFKQRAYFAPALRTKQGEFRRKTKWEYFTTPFTQIFGDGLSAGHGRRYPLSKKKTAESEVRTAEVEIPPYLADAAKETSVEVTGSYWFTGAGTFESAARVLPERAKVEQADARVKAAEAAFAKLAANAPNRAAEEAKLAGLRAQQTQAKVDLATARSAHLRSWEAALLDGRAEIRFEIDAPEYIVHARSKFPVGVYVRLDPGLRWERVGSGKVAGSGSLVGVDLTDTCAVPAPENLRDFGRLPLARTLEVAVSHTDPNNGPVEIGRTYVVDYALKPRNGAAPAAAAAEPKPSTPGSSESKTDPKVPSLGIELQDLELKLKGAVPAPTTGGGDSKTPAGGAKPKDSA